MSTYESYHFLPECLLKSRKFEEKNMSENSEKPEAFFHFLGESFINDRDVHLCA